MSKKVILSIIGVLVIVGGAAFAVMMMNSDDMAAPATETSSQASDLPLNKETTDNESEAKTATVITFTNDGFSPATLTVKKGTVVTVKNDSSTQVQFSSDDHPTHTINQGMNLRVLAAGESATFTADEVGTFGYHDHIDASKTGTLTVTQ